MMSMDIQWHLTSQAGMDYILPQTMIFLGREECDVTLQSRSVDKRHAVITYDHYEKRFKVKDLNSINGTYVNDVRIPGQTYMKLEHMDSIRFGYDPNEFKIQCNRIKPEGGSASSISPTTNKQISPEKSATKIMENQDKSQDQNTRHNDSGLQTLHANHVASSCSIETSSDSIKNYVSPQSSSEYFTTEISSNESLLYSDDNTNQSYNQKISGTTLSHLSHPPAESEQQVHPSIMGLKHSSCASSASVPLPPSSSVDSTSAATALASSSDTVNHVSFLPSAKHLLESTSSNTSLHSAFSGDSLDQLNDTPTNAAVTDSVPPENSKLNDLRGSEKLADDSFLSASSNVINNSQEGRTDRCSLVNKTNEPAETDQTVQYPENSLQHETAVLDHNAINNSKDSSVTDDLKGKQKSSATAFTIEFDNVKLSSKKLDIKDSISKFAPPKIENERHGHRRNHSLTKVEEHKIPGDIRYIYSDTSPEKVSDKFSLHKSGNNLKRGYHSEGYFSSDQDDDLSAKSERLGLKAKLMDKEKTNLKCQNKESSIVNPSAAFLIDKMLSDSEKEKKELKMPFKDFQEDIKKLSAAVQELNNNKNDNSKNLKERPCKLNVKSSILEDLDFLPLSIQSDIPKESLLNPASDDIRDNVSESGTYTIEKESPNLELEEARRNIDKVFGITLEEVEEPVITGPQILPLNIRESQHSPDSDSSKSKSDSTYKDGMNEWAYTDNRNLCSSPSSEQDISSRSDKSKKIRNRSVLEGHIETNHPSSVPSGSRFMKVISPENTQRPRRRLPTPPVDKLPFAIAFPRTSGSIDSDTSTYSNLNDLSLRHNSPDHRLNEMQFDTEKLLKETETVVSAMEARMDQRKAVITPLGSSLESRDSGGESDVDTSAASYCNDKKNNKQDRNISKRLSSQLKNKLKLLEESRHSPTKLLNKHVPCNSPSGKLTLRSKSMSMSQDHVGSDNASECETASVASDISSSSDISGSSPRTRRKGSEKSPPAMKFNRAFSLRRARLGYSSDNTSDKVLPPSHNTPSSSHRPKPKITESKKVESHKTHTSASSSSVAPLSRNDGGRFSLRAGKNAKGSSNKMEEQGKKHKSAGSSHSASRSNSTLSAKEMEMKNWRRRKEYDPMKAAAEGKKKEAAKKAAQDKQPVVTPAPATMVFQRSASFHGSEGFHRSRKNTYTSEDDMSRSLEEEQINNYNSRLKNCSDEPSIPMDKYLPPSQQINVKEPYNNEDYSYDEMKTQNHSDAWMSPPVIRSSQVNSHRHKAKIEALDSLVITTIHQMSSKLCGHTEALIRKLRSRCKTSVGKSHSIDDLLELLSTPDTPTSPTTRSISRELAGTLKNLKKLEKSLQGIEKLVCVENVPTDCSFPSSEQGHNTLYVNERC